MQNIAKPTKLRLWLLVVGVAFILIGTAYTLVQQSTRLAVNDLPLATAQIAQKELNVGLSANKVIPTTTTNMRDDTTVFTTITDANRHILATSSNLDGDAPLPPQGVFELTALRGKDHVTWQPTNGVRLATVILTYNYGNTRGFIITGQSLSQAEHRIAIYGWLSLASFIAVIVWASILIYWPPDRSPKSKQRK